MDFAIILGFLLMLFVAFCGIRFCRCAWCGRQTAQRDRSGYGDSAGICHTCAGKLRGRR